MKLFTVADYFVRHEHYVTVLCVNKDKPELECNGKCQLKELFTEEDGAVTKQPELPESLKVVKLEAVDRNTEFNFMMNWTPGKELRLNEDLPQSCFSCQVFVPPEAV